jgi:hypothetical protein
MQFSPGWYPPVSHHMPGDRRVLPERAIADEAVQTQYASLRDAAVGMASSGDRRCVSVEARRSHRDHRYVAAARAGKGFGDCPTVAAPKNALTVSLALFCRAALRAGGR